ncbi:inversin-A-like [Watersipora subatra]|uniref:inversin-A-like n=1 Tax=Watersipora subatra TaxID=2589382 RepID=UPI00355B2A02
MVENHTTKLIVKDLSLMLHNGCKHLKPKIQLFIQKLPTPIIQSLSEFLIVIGRANHLANLTSLKESLLRIAELADSQSRGRLLNEGRRHFQAIKDMKQPASISPTEYLQDTMEQWIREYIRASGAPDITSLRAALTTTPPDQLLQLITTIRDSKSYTALLLAIYRGHPEIAHMLLTPLKGIVDELLFEKDKGGYTALHWAVLKGDRELVELILHTVSSGKKYELIADKDGGGWTALTVAAWRGYTDIAETLLISLSVEQRVSLLNIQTNYYLNTALHCAAYSGHTAALQTMLTSIPPDKVSALLRIKNRDSRTPLEEAESEGRKETVELLKSWKQPVLAAHSATYQKFAALHKADNQKSKALTNQGEELAESKQQIGALQEEDNRKTAELANQREELTKLKYDLVESKQQISDLQEADNRKTAELANQREESQQQIVALQEANNQMIAALANQREESQQQIVALQEANNQMTTGKVFTHSSTGV